MEWWQAVLVSAGVLLALLALAAVLLWRTASNRTRGLAKRVQRLPWRAKLQLARAMISDSRMPPAVRLVPALLILYLAMPLDIVPDFIPIIGQLDDVLVVAVGAGLMLRFAPITVLEGHLQTLEAQQSG